MFVVYQPPVHKGQHGIVGRVLGGWTFAPIFSAGSGLPLAIFTKNTSEQSFGEADSSGNFFANATLTSRVSPVKLLCSSGLTTRAIRVTPIRDRAASAPGGTQSMFTNPEGACNLFRSPILGLDKGHINGGGNIRGLPFWNMDMSVGRQSISRSGSARSLLASLRTF
jgi:hypothetical protein